MSSEITKSQHTDRNSVTNYVVRKEDSHSYDENAKIILPPTLEAGAELQYAYSYFNDRLFGGELPNCLITYTRKSRVLGHFCPDRYQRVDGELWPELALNPTYMALREDRESLATLVHEQCHVWRHYSGPLNRKGKRGSSNGYHDIPWANQMEAVGLKPSSTAAPGGNRIGQRVSHYIIPGGHFDVACRELLDAGFKIHWRDKITFVKGADPNDPDGANGDGAAKKKDRVKFSCTNKTCGLNAWAKPTARLKCGFCDVPMHSPDSCSTSLIKI